MSERERKDAELVQKIRQQLQECEGWEGDAIAQQRSDAEDYYFQRARGDEVAGRSRVVSGDLSAMVEATLAQILDAFDSDAVAEFQPHGEADVDQAQLEGDAVQYFVMGAANGFLELAQAIKDILLIRNGIVKVYVERLRDSEAQSWPRGVKPEAFAELTHQPGKQVKVQKYDPKTGELRIRVTTERRRFTVTAVPLENFLYPKNWDSPYLQRIPFCAERHIETRAELVARGFAKSKVDKLRAIRADRPSAAARNPRRSAEISKGIDKTQESVEWFECYAMMDAGDGYAERRRIAVGSHGSDLLEDVLVRLVPYANGVAILNAHRFVGISLFDKLKQVQDLTTGLERALMDNVNTATKNRTAHLDGKVNQDDLDNGRTNGDLRVKGVPDVRQAIMAFQVPDLSPGILQNLQHMRARRTELGGAALDLASGQMQLNDRLGSQGLDRAYSVMEQLAAMMTKIAAVTLIRSVWLLAHETLRAEWREPVPVKQAHGRWQTAIPAKWPQRECLTVKPGMSPGERARRLSALDQMAGQQIQLAQLGMEEILVNVDGFYALMMDRARAADIANPERYFVDPRSDGARQAMTNKQASQKREADMREALMRQAIGLEQLGKALEKYKHDSELVFKYFAEVLGAEVEEAKLAGGGVVEFLKAKITAREAAKHGTQNGDARAADQSGEGAAK